MRPYQPYAWLKPLYKNMKKNFQEEDKSRKRMMRASFVTRCSMCANERTESHTQGKQREQFGKTCLCDDCYHYLCYKNKYRPKMGLGDQEQDGDSSSAVEEDPLSLREYVPWDIPRDDKESMDQVFTGWDEDQLAVRYTRTDLVKISSTHWLRTKMH